MSITNTLCFGDADIGVGGVPTIDGMVDYDFLPFNGSDPVETGYINGGRMTFAGGSLPRVIFQGVRNGASNRLVFGFLCRFDTSFDDEDFLVIALRGQVAVSNPARMIVVYPNRAGLGADVGVGDGPYQIKRNKLPRDVNYYRNGMSDPWEEYTETNVEVKVRSWKPGRTVGGLDECAWSIEVSVPRSTAGAASWMNIGDDFGLYFNLVRIINPGSLAVQSKFPTTSPDLTEEPGIAFAVPAWGHGLIPAAQVPVGSNLGVGVRIRNDYLGVGRRALGSSTTTLTHVIEGPTGPSDNELVALVENTGSAAANDLTAEFRFANWGMGPSGFNAWDLPLGLQPNPTPRRVGGGALDPPVDLPPGTVMSPATGELKSPWPRSAVPPAYQAHKHQCVWVQLSSATDVNFTQASVRRNMDFDHLSAIEREAEISGVGYPPPPEGGTAHDFVIESFCRPIALAELVGEGEEEGKLGDELIALVTGALDHADVHQAPVKGFGTVAMAATGPSIKNSIVYAWVVHGYRRTGTYLTVKGRKYENLDDGPGSFGIAAYHEGVGDRFSFAFKGPGLVQYAPGVYGLKVPHEGRAAIGVRIAAGPDEPAGDISQLDKAPWPNAGSQGVEKEGCLAMLLRLLGGKATGFLLAAGVAAALAVRTAG